MEQRKNEGIGRYALELVKALVVSIIITLALVLISAFIVKAFSVKTSYISIINQVIKGVSVLVSSLICLRLPSNGYIRGIILGVAYILLSYLVFSLFNGSFSGGISILNDLTLGAVSGLLSGIIAVNLRK